MSDIQHIDVDSDEFEGTPKALRDHVKKLQKANADLTQQITGLQGELTATALADVLAGFTKPERVKSALLSDGVDPLNSEAVAKWMEENGNDFARGEAAPAAPDTDQGAESTEDRSRLDVAAIGRPGSPNASALLNSVPKDLSPQETRQWILDNVPGA